MPPRLTRYDTYIANRGLLSVLSHNASTKSKRCDFPELLRPMMTLMGLIVSKPAHSFLKTKMSLEVYGINIHGKFSFRMSFVFI